MPVWERRRRMQALRRRVAGRDVLVWASDILDRLERRKGHGVPLWVDTEPSAGAQYDTSDVVAADVHRRLAGRHLLLLTDFDGTLSDLAPTPDEAVVSDAVRAKSIRSRCCRA